MLSIVTTTIMHLISLAKYLGTTVLIQQLVYERQQGSTPVQPYWYNIDCLFWCHHGDKAKECWSDKETGHKFPPGAQLALCSEISDQRWSSESRLWFFLQWRDIAERESPPWLRNRIAPPSLSFHLYYVTSEKRLHSFSTWVDVQWP